MCDFRVGEEVVYVGGRAPLHRPDQPSGLQVGSVHKIREILIHPIYGDVGIKIDARKNPIFASSFRRPQRRNLTEWLSTSIGNTDGLDKTRKVEKRERVE